MNEEMNKLLNRNCCFILFLNIYLFRVPNLKQRNSFNTQTPEKKRKASSLLLEKQIYSDKNQLAPQHTAKSNFTWV